MSITQKLRYLINKISQSTNSKALAKYEDVRPSANYSPWNIDKAFNQTYDQIQASTLVDKHRCFELWKLIEQSVKLEYGDIIEIGVWRGGTGALIAKQAAACKIPATVYLCDTFTGVVKASDKDSVYNGGEHSDASEQMVKDLIYKQMNIDNVQIFKGVFPDQTGDKMQNMKFRFCHIDVDVYQSAKDIVDWIWDKMVKGGIIVYDDYGFNGCDGITQYVEEQLHYQDRLIIHNLNGHAVVIKL